MGIFEIIFPSLKESSELRQEFFDRLPALVLTPFTGAPGLRALYRAKILHSEGPTVQGHPGFVAIPLWKDVSYFNNFVNSENYGNFKQAIGPYLTGPPDIQLYQSPGSGTAHELMENSSHVQVFKLNTHQSTGDLEKVGEAWSRFIQVVSDVAQDRDARVLPYFHQATGLRHVDGIYLGVIGWKSPSVQEDIFADAGVKDALKELEQTKGLESLSTLLVELSLIVPPTED